MICDMQRQPNRGRGDNRLRKGFKEGKNEEIQDIFMQQRLFKLAFGHLYQGNTCSVRASMMISAPTKGLFPPGPLMLLCPPHDVPWWHVSVTQVLATKNVHFVLGFPVFLLFCGMFNRLYHVVIQIRVLMISLWQQVTCFLCVKTVSVIIREGVLQDESVFLSRLNWVQ